MWPRRPAPADGVRPRATGNVPAHRSTRNIMLNPRVGTLALMVLAAAATRLLPHPPNLTAMTALALFGGSYFSDRRLAFGVPLLALLLSDLTLGLYWNWSFMA